MAETAKKNTSVKKKAKVIGAESRLSQLALRPGGVSRDAAVESANAAVDDLRTDYPKWLESDLATLQELILNTHANGGEDREELEEIYRKAAQIRDLGTSFDFPLITAAADSLCELIYRLMESSAYDSKGIDCHVKALKYLKRPKSQAGKDDQALPLVRGLKALVERHEKPKVPPTIKKSEG